MPDEIGEPAGPRRVNAESASQAGPSRTRDFDATQEFVMERLLPATEKVFDSESVCARVLVMPDADLDAAAQIRGTSLDAVRAGRPGECQMEISESIACEVEKALTTSPSEWTDPSMTRASLYVLVHEAIESIDARGSGPWSINSFDTTQAGLTLFCEGITDLAVTHFQDEILAKTGIAHWRTLEKIELTKKGYPLEQAASDIVISGLCGVADLELNDGVRWLVRANPGVDSLRAFVRKVLVASELKSAAATAVPLEDKVDQVVQSIATELSDKRFSKQHREMERQSTPGPISRIFRNRTKGLDTSGGPLMLGLHIGAKAWTQIKPVVTPHTSLQ